MARNHPDLSEVGEDPAGGASEIRWVCNPGWPFWWRLVTRQRTQGPGSWAACAHLAHQGSWVNVGLSYLNSHPMGKGVLSTGRERDNAAGPVCL